MATAPSCWRTPPASCSFKVVDGVCAQHMGREDAREFVIADQPFSRHRLSLPYFEMEVAAVQPATAKYLPTPVIGLRRNGTSTARAMLPGWTTDTIGYHGDDGNGFCRGGPAPLGAPDRPSTYGEGDIVGCGVLESGAAFFTLNGDLLGIPFPFENFAGALPVVGADCPMCLVANFGTRPFLADVVLVRGQAQGMWEARTVAPVGGPLQVLALNGPLAARVLAYACDEPRIVRKIGLLCSQWRERTLGKKGNGLWRWMSVSKWPLLPVERMKVRSWMQFYRRRARLAATSPHIIDNCVQQARLGTLGEASPAFMCPVVSDSLTRAGDVDGVLFCGVCASHVFPVASQAEANALVAEGKRVTPCRRPAPGMDGPESPSLASSRSEDLVRAGVIL